MRWTPKCKAAIVVAVQEGIISIAEARERHDLSEEELAAWMRDYAAHGRPGLRLTKRRQYHPLRLAKAADGQKQRTGKRKGRGGKREPRPVSRAGKARIWETMPTNLTRGDAE